MTTQSTQSARIQTPDLSDVLDVLDQWIAAHPRLTRFRLGYDVGDARVTVEIDRRALDGEVSR